MEIGADAVELFESQMIVERMISSLYRSFSERFSSVNEARRFWLGMSEEELMHEVTMASCIKRVPKMKGRLTAPAADRSDIVHDITLLGKYLREAPSGTLKEALAVTRELEFSEADQRFWRLLRLPKDDLFADLVGKAVRESTGYHALLPELMQSLDVMAP